MPAQCKFGRGCTRADCRFKHPSGRDTKTGASNKTQSTKKQSTPLSVSKGASRSTKKKQSTALSIFSPFANGGASGGDTFQVAARCGSRTEVLTVEKRSKPAVKLVLCSAVDASYSMSGTPCRNAIDALVGEKGVVRSLLRPTDLFGCCTFSDEVRNLHHPSELTKIDLGRDAKSILSNTEKGRSTAIFDAIKQGISDMRKTLQIVRKQSGGKKQHLCLEHLVITDGADNSSSTSFTEICELVAKPGLPHYHLLIIGAGMQDEEQATMQRLCRPAHCTFVPSTSDLSQLQALLGSFKQEVRVRMQLLVHDNGQSSLTQWEGKENHAAAAAGALLSQASLLTGQLGGLRIACGEPAKKGGQLKLKKRAAGGPKKSRPGVGAEIVSVANGTSWGVVTADGGSIWRLSGGRIAKKAREGSAWRWR
jgi:hypothetical protein